MKRLLQLLPLIAALALVALPLLAHGQTYYAPPNSTTICVDGVCTTNHFDGGYFQPGQIRMPRSVTVHEQAPQSYQSYQSYSTSYSAPVPHTAYQSRVTSQPVYRRERVVQRQGVLGSSYRYSGVTRGGGYSVGYSGGYYGGGAGFYSSNCVGGVCY